MHARNEVHFPRIPDMDFILLVFLSAILIAPLHLAIEWEITRVVAAEDDRVRRIVRAPIENCDALGPVIGTWNGTTIYGTVTYMGMLYEYDRLAPPRYDRVLQQNELFLDPGLVYVSQT